MSLRMQLHQQTAVVPSNCKDENRSAPVLLLHRQAFRHTVGLQVGRVDYRRSLLGFLGSQ